MNLQNLQDLHAANPPASGMALAQLEGAMGAPLPQVLRELWAIADGFRLANGVGVYGSDEIEERNATFEVALYAPGHLAIGDDSGGRAVMMRCWDGRIYWVHQGVMDPAAMEHVADSLREWIDGGCAMRA
jgi:hypothetical protein